MRSAIISLLLVFVCFGWRPWLSAAETGDEAVRSFSLSYVAPTLGSSFMRMYNPALGMVEFRRIGTSADYEGAAGWRAKKEGTQTVVYPPDVRNGICYFEGGRPKLFECGTAKYAIQLSDEDDVSIRGMLPPIVASDEADHEYVEPGKWVGRFTMFYANPNRTAVLLGCLILIALTLAVQMRRWPYRVVGILASGVLFPLLWKTGSRGGLIAFWLSALVVIGWWLFRNRRWKVWLSALAGLLLALASIAVVGKGGFVFRNIMETGNSWRIEILKVVPRMMYDAPGGWTLETSGQAFMDWYQKMDAPYVVWNLISAHLSTLIECGWFGRFVWLTVWIGGIASLLVFAKRGGSPLPAALWLLLGLAGVFNPVFSSWTLWLLPTASLGLVVWQRPWRTWQNYLLPCGFGTVVSLSLLVTVWFIGWGTDLKGKPRVKVRHGAVLVNGDKPTCWLVDDEETLGWKRCGREVRAYYQHFPETPALGFAKRLKAVPARVTRLVVVGRQCERYLKLRLIGEEPKADELMFLSPPFGPSRIPPGILKSCRFQMFVGEFALRFVDVYGRGPYPDWLGCVEGAEVYIPGWMSLVAKR